MTYTKQSWANGTAGGTPLTAARLNYIETGLEAIGLDKTTSSNVALRSPSAFTLYVDNALGSDANDGRSHGSAKATIAAAYAALPAAGGKVVLLTSASGYHLMTSTLTVTKPFWLEGIMTGQGAIRRTFDGDLFVIRVSSGGMRNLVIDDDGLGSAARTGAAIKIEATALANTSELRFEHIKVTSSEAAGSWERILVIDGSLRANGVRQVGFTNCSFFGSRTPDESILITDGHSIEFIGGFQTGAPTAITQGMKILNSRVGDPLYTSSDIKLIGFVNGGNLYSDGTQLSVIGGRISGTVNLTSISTLTDIHAEVGGAVTNNSASAVIWNTGSVSTIAVGGTAVANTALTVRQPGAGGNGLLVRANAAAVGFVLKGDNATGTATTFGFTHSGTLDVPQIQGLTETGPYLYPTTSAFSFNARNNSDNVITIDHTGAPTGDYLRIGASLSRFNKGGYFMTRKVAAPADADLAASEMALWLDDTNGAAKLMVKAKQADGTVRTAAVALA